MFAILLALMDFLVTLQQGTVNPVTLDVQCVQ